MICGSSLPLAATSWMRAPSWIVIHPSSPRLKVPEMETCVSSSNVALLPVNSTSPSRIQPPEPVNSSRPVIGPSNRAPLVTASVPAPAPNATRPNIWLPSVTSTVARALPSRSTACGALRKV